MNRTLHQFALAMKMFETVTTTAVLATLDAPADSPKVRATLTHYQQVCRELSAAVAAQLCSSYYAELQQAILAVFSLHAAFVQSIQSDTLDAALEDYRAIDTVLQRLSAIAADLDMQERAVGEE